MFGLVKRQRRRKMNPKMGQVGSNLDAAFVVRCLHAVGSFRSLRNLFMDEKLVGLCLVCWWCDRRRQMTDIRLSRRLLLVAADAPGLFSTRQLLLQLFLFDVNDMHGWLKLKTILGTVIKGEVCLSQGNSYFRLPPSFLPLFLLFRLER